MKLKLSGLGPYYVLLIYPDYNESRLFWVHGHVYRKFSLPLQVGVVKRHDSLSWNESIPS